MPRDALPAPRLSRASRVPCHPRGTALTPRGLLCPPSPVPPGTAAADRLLCVFNASNPLPRHPAGPPSAVGLSLSPIPAGLSLLCSPHRRLLWAMRRVCKYGTAP